MEKEKITIDSLVKQAKDYDENLLSVIFDNASEITRTSKALSSALLKEMSGMVRTRDANAYCKELLEVLKEYHPKLFDKE